LRVEVLKSGLSLAGDPDGAERVEQLVRTTGNAERGRAIFLDAAKSTCITCHALEGRGGQIGPDLTGLTKNATVAKLVESIVEPSKEIKEGFEQYVVQTTDGQTYAGYKTAAEAGRVVLRDAQGNDVVIPAERVKRQVKSNLSLMPEGSYGLLTLGELADLVAFLADADAQAALRDAVP
jgi:putative heme-binding domain-containing protein